MNYYYLKLFKNLIFSDLSIKALGIDKNIKDISRLKHYFSKARLNQYDKIKIPFDSSQINHLTNLINLSNENKLELVLQVDVNQYHYFKDTNLEIEVLSSRIQDITLNNENHYLTFIVHKNSEIYNLTTTKNNNYYFYFSPNYSLFPDFLNCGEIHKLTLIHKNIRFNRPPGNILWDHRIPESLELCPIYEPVYSSKNYPSKTKFSFIIPIYNNKKYIQTTLKNISLVKQPKTDFEIILIDDGSNDGTQEELTKYISNSLLDINIKYFYVPRFQMRAMGDAQYRAGISRNFGVLQAIGEIFCFLDSDIIIPDNYLELVEKNLTNHQLTQFVRHDLNKNISLNNPLHGIINPQNDLSNKDNYWTNFHKETEDWNKLEDKWKYLCTHTLTIKRKDFQAFGLFEKNFIFYGFEDTDLGLKLASKNFSFKLVKEPVYHLYHFNSRSEFFNSNYLRSILLSRTAQIFYLLHLDSNIFLKFRGLMDSEVSISSLCRALAYRFRMKTFKKHNVFKVT